ncbi:MAG: glycoside hydrolase family 76 protein [Solirubrobacteraceae bacterium]
MDARERATYARHAVHAYRALRRQFRKRDGSYRYDEGPRWLRRGAQLWPFGRALAATLDVAGIPSELVEDDEAETAIPEHLEILERYWDPAGPRPAYCADVTGASRRGDRYYDDNAWIGLALIQLERMRRGSGRIDRAAQLFEFASHGWADAAGGGVYWVEQGRGTGVRNQDRNTVSNAPNAELGFHLTELGQPPASAEHGPQDMYRWVLSTLDDSHTGASPGTGLFWDKVRGDGSIDRATWSYNQGTMIGANVLLARLDPDRRERYLNLAGAITHKTLREGNGAYRSQPPPFTAIFFRNLLLLHGASQDEELRSTIIDAVRAYADAALANARDRRYLFHMRGRPALLDQSAIVQVLALLAWNPEAYGLLA